MLLKYLTYELTVLGENVNIRPNIYTVKYIYIMNF